MEVVICQKLILLHIFQNPMCFKTLGPSKITIVSGKKIWFVTFIDDYTRLYYFYLMSGEFEVTISFLPNDRKTRIKILYFIMEHNTLD